jgi:hypothetical protein
MPIATQNLAAIIRDASRLFTAMGIGSFNGQP